MNFITLKELKKMVPVASEFKRVPGLKKILEDGIEVILRKQMENHAEVVVYKNGYVSYHAHERYTVFALHNCTHYYYESQGNEHQTIPHAMGDESNEFHREVVRPKVTELLSPNPADYILDIACGNGNYSSYLAQRGASVVAFDYSKKMIELAKRRQSQYPIRWID